MSSNVVRLPTAARRQVQNPVRAAREYRRSQPQWPRPPMPDYMQDGALARAFERRARQSTEIIIALAILKALPDDQRQKAHEAMRALHRAAPDNLSWLAILLAGEVG